MSLRDEIAAEERRRLSRSIPMPPPEMRQLVGPLDDASYDNPSGGLVYPYLAPDLYEAVFDFGCGCGRFARQLLLQDPRPRRYLGVDIHRGMIEWCRRNLAPCVPHFEFHHHDVFAAAFNPESTASTAPFSADQHSFTLVHAWSVFTHLVQSQTPHYLREAARLLRPEGVLHSTWFLFDKRAYPMLQDSSNALYVNDVDPSAAVIYDREWLRSTVREAGLVLVDARPPAIRGFQWVLVFAPVQSRREEVELPEDRAPFGRAQAPSMPANASRIGLEAGGG